MRESEEIWKDIEGYEGLYQVSNLGNVKSLKRKGRLEERLLSQVKDKDGYLAVQLYKLGEGKRTSVHRLVANAFLPNPDNLPQVNHKDETPSHNNVDNLEWCTQKYNNIYGTRIQRITDKLKKTVYQYTLDNQLVKVWKSVMECERNGYSHRHISKCCLGKSNTHKGYIWRYE